MVTAIAAVAATIASEVVLRLVGKRLVLTIIEIEQCQLLIDSPETQTRTGDKSPFSERGRMVLWADN